MSAAQRAAVRADYRAILGTRQRAPNGIFEQLAEKHRLSPYTIKNILHGPQPGEPQKAASTEMSRAAAQKIAAMRRPSTTSTKNDEQPRERTVELAADGRVHLYSAACWCRKGPNRAGNYWCDNKPTDGKPKTLPGLMEPKPRAERYWQGRQRSEQQ